MFVVFSRARKSVDAPSHFGVPILVSFCFQRRKSVRLLDQLLALEVLLQVEYLAGVEQHEYDHR